MVASEGGWDGKEALLFLKKKKQKNCAHLALLWRNGEANEPRSLTEGWPYNLKAYVIKVFCFFFTKKKRFLALPPRAFR